MNNLWIFALLISSSFFGFEKLNSKYWVQYGSPDAESQVVEYFSLSCPQCLKFFNQEFPSIQRNYVDPGTISWSMHPDPADLLTLQAMICLERLSPEHKALFLKTIIDGMSKCKGTEQGCNLMKAAMEAFQNPIPDLENLEFIQKTEAFQDAFSFVTQKDVVRVIPSVEIDGILYKQFPNAALIDAHIHNPKRPS